MNVKELLTKIWENSIKEAYESGEICSERHLQAVFYKNLKEYLIDNKDMNVFVEPKLFSSGKHSRINNLIPDLIITRKEEIICIIELKYVPHSYSPYQHDLEKFELYFHCTNEPIHLLTNPDNGQWNMDQSYSISKNLLCVFAIITKSESQLLMESIVEEQLANKNFQILLGKIDHENKKREFYCVY